LTICLWLFQQIIAPTNLELDETVRACPDTSVHIQIKFNVAGCFSRYGALALKEIYAAPNKPTMGLCFMSSPWRDETDGAVRHEILHALGAVHEHQRFECLADLDLNKLRAERHFSKDERKTKRCSKLI
jgi:hypothetical protein